MLYLILGILCNVILLVIIKSFDKFKIPTLQGIVVNYFIAGSVAVFFVPDKVSLHYVFSASWMPAGIILGFLFISIFYLISLTARSINIAVATVANKMSVVIPVIAAFILYKDVINAFKIAGVVLALLSVYLIAYRKPINEVSNKRNFLLPFLVFVGSGIIDAIVNYTNKRLLHTSFDDALFTASGFFMAGLIGTIWLILLIGTGRQKWVWRSVLGGFVLGVPNFFSIYFILKALSSNVLESSQLYPVANISIVLLSVLSGLILFHEKLNRINYLGILISVTAILLIMR